MDIRDRNVKLNFGRFRPSQILGTHAPKKLYRDSFACLFDRYFFLVDIGNVPLTISVTSCSSVISMTVLWRTMPDDEDYYYDDDDQDFAYDVGAYVRIVNHRP